VGWLACGRKERKVCGLAWLGLRKREREEMDRLGRKGTKERGERFRDFSFKILFKFIFQTFKLHSNKKPCIRIMVHKHLLFLILFK
jgi:hypothetical protein